SPCFRETSTMTASGSSSRISDFASRAVSASPHTSRSDSASIKRRRPCRTIGWSSTIRTRRLRSFGTPAGGLCIVLNKEVPTVIASLLSKIAHLNPESVLHQKRGENFISYYLVNAAARPLAARLSLARRIRRPKRDRAFAYDACSARRRALEAHLSAQHTRPVSHNLQSHAGSLLGLGWHPSPVVGDRQAHLSARNMQVQSYSPRLPVPDRVAYRLLRDSI